MQAYCWSDLSVGMNAQFRVRLTAEAIWQFSCLSGDTNPLHLDEQFARAAGFRSQVAFGLLTSSYYSQLVGVHLPGKWTLLHGLVVEFKAPAYSGDELTVFGEIVHMTEAYRRLEVKAQISRDNVVISKATIQAGVREP